jgi:hypothetical protein
MRSVLRRFFGTQHGSDQIRILRVGNRASFGDESNFIGLSSSFRDGFRMRNLFDFASILQLHRLQRRDHV